MLTLRDVLGDEGGFVHKRIFGGIKGAVGGLIGGGPGGLIGGAIGGFVGGGKGAGEGGCPPGFSRDASGNCISSKALADFRLERERKKLFPSPFRPVTGTPFSGGAPLPFITPTRPPTGEEGLLLPFGEAVMGRFGAGLKPAVFSQQRRACPRGSVLGAPEPDGSSLCYNKRDISNKERAWPRGRRPLLTGGEMRAISTASAAAKKLQRKQKQLESLGLLKRPAPRTRRALPAGHTATLTH